MDVVVPDADDDMDLAADVVVDADDGTDAPAKIHLQAVVTPFGRAMALYGDEVCGMLSWLISPSRLLIFVNQNLLGDPVLTEACK